MKKIAFPPGLDAKALKSMNPVTFAALKVVDIKPYWIGGVLPAKKEGVCPNCKRQMQICAAGLCGACYHVAAGKVGVEMFEALIAIAKRVGSGGEAKVDPAPELAGVHGGTDSDGGLDAGQVVSPPSSPSPADVRLAELEAFWEQITLCMQTSLSPCPPSTASVVNAVITMQKKLAKRDVEVSRSLEILAQGTNGIRWVGVEFLEDACTRVMAKLHESAEDTKRLPFELPEEIDPSTMAGSIRLECRRLADFLVAKNQSYGDSAAHPVRIFSRADSEEQIKVRIDDKLSRISNGQGYPGDNDVQDLLGYLLLLSAVRVHKQALLDKEQGKVIQAQAA